MSVQARKALPTDIAEIAIIYNQGIIDRVATFILDSLNKESKRFLTMVKPR